MSKAAKQTYIANRTSQSDPRNYFVQLWKIVVIFVDIQVATKNFDDDLIQAQQTT